MTGHFQHPFSNLHYTVVVPFGKSDGDIARCIQAAMSQTCLPEKVVVVCNGPVSLEYATSSLNELLRQYSSTLLLVRCDTCTNANDARNFGLDHVDTDWVSFLDSDDWWDPTWISAVQGCIQSSSADFAYGSLRIHGAKGHTNELMCQHWSSHGTAENYLLAYLPAQTSSYFIRAEAARAIGWRRDLRRHQDYDFFARSLHSPIKVATVPGVHVNVDWRAPRRHQFHLDCLTVVSPWKQRVELAHYRRHIRKLLQSAILSHDWRALLPIAYELTKVSLRATSRGFLNRAQQKNDCSE